MLHHLLKLLQTPAISVQEIRTHRWLLELMLQKPREETMVDGFDVSGLDTPWDDDEEDESSANTTQSQRRQTACPSHERTLPVDDIVKLLDMKEEGISGAKMIHWVLLNLQF